MDRLAQDSAADLYGLKVEDVTVKVGDEPGKEVTGKALKYTGNEQSAPVGVAFVRAHQIDGSRAHHEVVLYREATFAMPKDAAKTMEDKIEWRATTPEACQTP